MTANEQCDMQLYPLRVSAHTSPGLFLNAKITRSSFLPIVGYHLHRDPLDLHVVFYGFEKLLQNILE